MREGIKKKYDCYHLKNKVTYPDFEYNSNRANYEPLKDSFIEEFFLVRGIDRIDNTLHIPSTSTLVQIFCDDAYVPTRKILNTCRVYAETAPAGTLTGVAATTELTTAGHTRSYTSRTGRIITAVLIVLAGVALYAVELQRHSGTQASGLVIERPANGKTVPMIAVVEGRVSNATTVWIVVRDIRSDTYYVQHPITVEDDGTWRGAIHIGGTNKAHIGALVQIRAFVNPSRMMKLSDEDILYLWPEAELSSAAVAVVRGAETE